MGDSLKIKISHLTCPVCAVVFSRKIYNCIKGHVICEACALELEACPSCKERIDAEGVNLIRNLSLEQIRDDGVACCPFQEHGCPITMPLRGIKEHLKQCEANPHKIYLCKLLGMDCDYKSNSFDPKSTMDHLVNSHGAVGVKGNRVSIGIVDKFEGMNSDGKWQPVILEGDKQTVVVLLFYKKRKDYLSLVLVSLEPDLSNPTGITGMGSFIVCNDEGGINRTEATPLIHSLLTTESVIKSPGLRMDPELVKSYRTVQGYVYFDVFIGDPADCTQRLKGIRLPEMEQATLLDSDEDEDE